MPLYRIEMHGSKVEAKHQWRRVKANALALADSLWNRMRSVQVYELPFSGQKDTEGGDLIWEHPAQVRPQNLEEMIKDI